MQRDCPRKSVNLRHARDAQNFQSRSLVRRLREGGKGNEPASTDAIASPEMCNVSADAPKPSRYRRPPRRPGSRSASPHARVCGPAPSLSRLGKEAAILKRSSPWFPLRAARSSSPGQALENERGGGRPCAQDAAIVRAFSALVLGRPRHRGRRQQAARSVDGGHGLTGSVQNQQMETFRSVNLSTLGTSRCASWFSKSQRERSTRRAS